MVQLDRERGFTLLEVMVAVLLLGSLIAASTSAFVMNVRSNQAGEIRSEASQAAQTVLDELRHSPVGNMPLTGSDEPRTVSINERRAFDVVVTYCENNTYCTSNEIRHLTVEVTYADETVYRTETVFTNLGSTKGGESNPESSSSSGGTSSSGGSSSSSGSSASSSSASSSSSSSSGNPRDSWCWLFRC